MKKILLFILVLLGIFITYPQDIVNHEQSNKADFPTMLRYLISDSLLQILEGKSFLIYSYGHHGAIWSLIYRDDESYQICIGTTRETKLNADAIIDTVALINDYKNMIQWGMDSLPSFAGDMVPCHKEYSSWSHRSLDVYHSNREVFSSGGLEYSGPDNIAFNKKLGELCYLMWWLSDPSIREFLPGFEQFENRESNFNNDSPPINQ